MAVETGGGQTAVCEISGFKVIFNRAVSAGSHQTGTKSNVVKTMRGLEHHPYGDRLREWRLRRLEKRRL